MAQKKISDLASLAAPDATDIVPIVDVSTNTTKKITVGSIVTATPAGSVTSSMLADSSVQGSKMGQPIAFNASVSASVPNSYAAVNPTCTEVFDYGSAFASNSFTAPYKGVYRLDLNWTYSNAYGGRCESQILRNGSEQLAFCFAYGGTATTYDPTTEISVLVQLNASDVITWTAQFQGTPATTALSGNVSGNLVGRVA